MDLNTRVLSIVESVLRQASRDNPADGVLRTELRKAGGLTPHQSATVARAVFAWHRWLGWLDRDRPVAETVDEALFLQERLAEDPTSFTDDELVARAIPDWIRKQVNVDPAWIRQLQREPKLWLRARKGKSHELARRLGEDAVPPHPPIGEALEFRGWQDLFRHPDFQAGEFEVQDISSQCVGLVCDPKPGETWWDACAGEGGKLLHLSDLMENKGLIWASDRAAWRLKRLKLRAGRAKAFNYRSVLWESETTLPTRTKFDGVLLDAPCSGVGTWQKNPHSRWTTNERDVEELAVIQKRLLGQVAASVKPGGRLIYAVCTLTQAETTEVVSSFQDACPDFMPLEFSNPARPEAPHSSTLWLWPQEVDGNGMFVAMWRRK